MTPEERFVVNPLEKYFRNPDRSGAVWWVKAKPHFGTAATGWDLQVERHNQVLLIEAKYIRAAFAASFVGLVISPLSLRREVMKRKSLKKSWSAVICWAIGSGYNKVAKYRMRDIHQILFDYIARNIPFWKFYSKSLKVRYIYFVDKNKVAKISFMRFIGLAEKYHSVLEKPIPIKRAKAAELLKNLHWA